MIKSLIGKGHPEFSTSHQQDVQEYFMHVMDIIEKNETNAERLQDLFKFQVFSVAFCCLFSSELEHNFLSKRHYFLSKYV